ncbi:MAG: S-layer homology domain-containing protein [Ruminiclostridium sp.]|nr:S-layer homology domain-containing protein [Ruminiclostridium sp.]MBQ9933853.1 S-layer homology domain-containing protein [Ruminiclostridium sp.]
MKKRLLPLILALAMALSMMPLASAEYIIETPHLEIGENGALYFEDENVPSLSKNSYGKGWSWNASTYTLTLNGVNDPSLSLGIYEAQKPVTIVVKGTNTMYSLSEGSQTGWYEATSTMTGSGTLNLTGYSGGVDVVNGPTVNASKSFYVDTLKAGTVTMGNPLSMPVTVTGGCLIIDARDYLAQDSYTDESRKSAIAISTERAPSDFLKDCVLKDKSGKTVTLEKRPIIFSSGSIYGYDLVAVKSNGDCADYVKITPANYNPFADVKTSDYFAKPVLWAVDKGITNGTSATKFSPNQTCTQGQIVTFIARAADAGTVSGSSPYSNSAITSDQYFYNPLLWAHKNGIVTDTAIDPNAGCTRSDVVLYLWRLDGSPKASGSTFTDVPSDAPYAQAVGWAVKEGITTGTSATTFSPDQTCTRGQIVTFLHRDLA